MGKNTKEKNNTSSRTKDQDNAFASMVKNIDWSKIIGPVVVGLALTIAIMHYLDDVYTKQIAKSLIAQSWASLSAMILFAVIELGYIVWYLRIGALHYKKQSLDGTLT